ncbi:glycosyltransferase family 2 protein [Halomarina ordinaria]|uniref:Glycosyltransferase family 2 protein n=1 Tax=Halomarina ordinaria TaxID=3033939 RepID=A0ABD5U854_9EURY|nr:glycosyltransferase family 2 protein [Halomarina sp. PSRA2]
MQLSVVVPTLNGRERLVRCLDALAAYAPAAEVVVVNGPSVDGTTGAVREREDVDVLVEIDERNIDVARNAGADRARGECVAFLDYAVLVEPGWYGAVLDALAAPGSAHRASGHGPDVPDVVSGPTRRPLPGGGVSSETVERRRMGGREVTYLNGGNVAFRREALDAIDGFDEYLVTGGARDAAHRLAVQGFSVDWCPAMAVNTDLADGDLAGIREPSLRADGGEHTRDWAWRYRSLTYRLVKNYGLRSCWRVGRHALDDAVGALTDVARGERRPSSWLGNGRDVLVGTVSGLHAGAGARVRDRTRRRNPRGLSSRSDRAVAVYDRRD